MPNRSRRFERATGQESGLWLDFVGAGSHMKCDQVKCGGRGALMRFRLMASGHAIACPQCGEMIAIPGAIQALVAILLLFGLGFTIAALRFAVLPAGLGALVMAVCLWFIAPVRRISGRQLSWRTAIELAMATLMVAGVFSLVTYVVLMR